MNGKKNYRGLLIDQEVYDILRYMHNVEEFKSELVDLSKIWDQLTLLSQLGSLGTDITSTKENFNTLTSELINNLAKESIKKIVSQMESKAQVAVDIVIRNLFERTADIGFLATDDDIREYIQNFSILSKSVIDTKNDSDDTAHRTHKLKLKKQMQNIKDRFKEYVAKYSVYYDIVLFDTNGRIIANLNSTNSLDVSKDEILEIAKHTQEEYIETYKYHDFLPTQEKSLVYTYKVTESNDSDNIIGYLSLCFKFEDEMSGIFGNLTQKGSKEAILLLDKDSTVIASSDIYHIPLGAKLNTDTTKKYIITTFAGRDYLSTTCTTNGYEGFEGLGWLGHIMIPLDFAFEDKNEHIQIDDHVLQSIMKNESLFEKELLNIPIEANRIQSELDRAVWNGNVRQAHIETNTTFSRSILREIRNTGEMTKETFNIAIENLNHTIISSLLDRAKFLASLSIDIMDRNLYERANDVRWWALSSKFKEVLQKSNIEDEDKEQISSILKYINNLYTVYTNLFIYDTSGKIIAVSNDEESHIVGNRITKEWLKDTLSLKDSSKYRVSPYEKTNLYDDDYTYIYATSITDTSNTSVVGGIGIVFDSTSQFSGMLKDALPDDENIFSIFVDKDSAKVISSSNDIHNIGDIIDIDSEFLALENGQSISKIIEYKDKYYIVGAECSKGYREYKRDDDYTNDVIALVFIQAGIPQETLQAKTTKNNYYHYNLLPNEDAEEIASFYIGSKWVGVYAEKIVEVVNMQNLETPLCVGGSGYFKGTISHKENIISIIDISSLVKADNEDELRDIIILRYGSNTKHLIGIVVNRLGEIMRVPAKSIVPFEKHLISGGTLGESILRPPEGEKSDNLLTIIDIAKINELKNDKTD
jgi:chemotaxis signal transduction protein